MINPLLQRSAALVHEDKKEEARSLLIQAVKENPKDAAAWYGLSFCVDDLQHKKDCLQRALQISPNYPQAQRALDYINNIKSQASDNPNEGSTKSNSPNTGDLPQIPHTDQLSEIKIIKEPIQPLSTVQKQGNNFNTPGISVTYSHDTGENERKDNRIRFRSAGESTYEMGDKRRRGAIIIAIIVIAIIAFIGFFVLPNAKAFGISGIGILVLFFIGFRILPDWLESHTKKKSKEWKRAYRGADAEVEISDILEELGDDFLIINDVDCDYGNIDHIVISSTGNIFQIETKSHHGTIEVEDGEILLNGHETEKDFINQVLGNSIWMQEKIKPIISQKPWITLILVFTNAFVEFSKPIKGVNIINKKYLLKTIRYNNKFRSSNRKVWEKREDILHLFSTFS